MQHGGWQISDDASGRGRDDAAIAEGGRARYDDVVFTAHRSLPELGLRGLLPLSIWGEPTPYCKG